MTFVMWMKYFFESQVQFVDINYLLKPLESDVTIEQDNTSAIQLENYIYGNQTVKEPNISTYDVFI